MKGKTSRNRKSAGRSKTTASKVRPGDVPNQAAASGFLQTVLDYLERDGDVNAQGLLDETLLYSAVGGGKWKVVDALLKAGADVTGPNYVGETPLHRAADLGLADFVEALLARGADPNTRPLSDIRPLHASVVEPNRESRRRAQGSAQAPEAQGDTAPAEGGGGSKRSGGRGTNGAGPLRRVCKQGRSC